MVVEQEKLSVPEATFVERYTGPDLFRVEVESLQNLQNRAAEPDRSLRIVLDTIGAHHETAPAVRQMDGHLVHDGFFGDRDGTRQIRQTMSDGARAHADRLRGVTFDRQRTGTKFTFRRQDAVHHSALEQPAEMGRGADMRERAFHQRAVERNPMQKGGQLGQRAPRLAGERERELLIEVEERNLGQGASQMRQAGGQVRVEVKEAGIERDIMA